MSYDLAIWEGQCPADGDEALEVFAGLAERYLEDGDEPPNPRIARYVEAMLERWPDISEDGSPWSSSGTGDASGPVLCMTIRLDHAEKVSVDAADVAQQHGLVCLDLQQGRLRP